MPWLSCLELSLFEICREANARFLLQCTHSVNTLYTPQDTHGLLSAVKLLPLYWTIPTYHSNSSPASLEMLRVQIFPFPFSLEGYCKLIILRPGRILAIGNVFGSDFSSKYPLHNAYILLSLSFKKIYKLSKVHGAKA